MESELINLLVAEAIKVGNLRVCTQDERTQLIVLRMALKFKRCTLTEAIKRLKKLNLPLEIYENAVDSFVDIDPHPGVVLPIPKSAEKPNLDSYDRWSFEFTKKR